MQDVIEAVEVGNRDIMALASIIEASQERSVSAGQLPDPTVMLGGSPFPIHTARGEQILQFRVEQMLPWPGKRELQRELARLDTGMKAENLRQMRSGLVLDALQTVLAIQKTDRMKAVVVDFTDRLMQFESVALSRYETSEGAQQAVWKLQLAIAQQDQMLLQLDAEREMALARLQQLVHRPVSILEGAVVFESSPIPVGSPVDRAEYRALQLAADKAVLSAEMVRLQNRPDFGLSVNWMAIRESDIPASSDGRDALGLGVMFRVPLGKTQQRAREEEARLNLEIQQIGMEGFIASWDAMWSEQLSRYDRLNEQLDHLQNRLLPVASSMLSSSLQGYGSGTTGFLDALDAERSAFELSQKEVDLEIGVEMARWALYRLSGALESPSDNPNLN